METLEAEWKDIDVLVNNAYVSRRSPTASRLLRHTGDCMGNVEDSSTDICNSGMVRGVARSPDISPSDVQAMLAVNVTSLITLTQTVMKIFKTRPEGGRGDIINLGSIAGREGYPGGSIYCATKAAVRTFTDALRKEVIDTRIRVMEIDPGQVETEFSIVRFGGDKEKAAKVYEGYVVQDSTKIHFRA